MLTESTIIDKIEVVSEYRIVQVRSATVISRDGQEITRTFSRHCINPGDDYSNEDAAVVAVCQAVHTPEVTEAFAQHIATEAD